MHQKNLNIRQMWKLYSADINPEDRGVDVIIKQFEILHPNETVNMLDPLSMSVRHSLGLESVSYPEFVGVLKGILGGRSE